MGLLLLIILVVLVRNGKVCNGRSPVNLDSDGAEDVVVVVVVAGWLDVDDIGFIGWSESLVVVVVVEEPLQQ